VISCNSSNPSIKETINEEKNIFKIDSTVNTVTVITIDTSIKVDSALPSIKSSRKYQKNNSSDVNDWFFSQGEYAYFKIGSTEEEVLNIQGEPSSSYESYDTKIYYWGNNSVTFKGGKVVAFNNWNGRLKVFRKKAPK
jgi:hypothetical protein